MKIDGAICPWGGHGAGEVPADASVDVASDTPAGADKAGSGWDPAPRIRLPSYSAPSAFPGATAWIGAARRNALDLLPERCFDELRVDHQIGFFRLSIISDPASIDRIFVRRPQDFELCNLHLRMLRPSLGSGLIVAQGENWRRLRRASLMLIARRGREDAQGASADAAQLADCFGQHPAFAAKLAQLALDHVARSILGHDQPIASDAVSSAIERHRLVSERVDLFDVLGVSASLGSGRMRRARRIATAFDHEIAEQIERTGTPPPAQVQPHERRDFVVNLLTGYESVWLTCLWTLLIMAYAPEIERWVRSASPGETRRARLQAVVREVLRLFPPLPLICRTPRKICDLPSGRVRKGQMLCVSPYVVHRHRALWDEPEVFAPDRPQQDAAEGHYLPFGLGARRCVGAGTGQRLVLDLLDGLLSEHRPVGATAFSLPRAGMSLRPLPGYDLRMMAC